LGRPKFTTQNDGWKQIEPQIKFIHPAARHMAESCMELPDLSCTNPDIRAYTNRARQNFEENCKSSFYNLPLHKLHPFQPTIKDTPSTSANTTKSLENEKQQNPKVMTHFLRNN
jgi:hypothetical protein